MQTYKVIEISMVTDEELERVINEHVGQGFQLEGIHFAMRDSSRRPAMAFVMFTQNGVKRRAKSR